jgi:hypothetical protein
MHVQDAMADPISDELKNLDTDTQVAKLRAAGYMSPASPQFVGLGFACAQCDWYSGVRKGLPAERVLVGECANPNVLAYVEHSGCCNLFSFKGVNSVPEAKSNSPL